jgi:hypothetical protein
MFGRREEWSVKVEGVERGYPFPLFEFFLN